MSQILGINLLYLKVVNIDILGINLLYTSILVYTSEEILGIILFYPKKSEEILGINLLYPKVVKRY
jgi:hypothetical protein